MELPRALAISSELDYIVAMFLLPLIKKVTQHVMVTIFSILEIVGLPRIEDRESDEKKGGA